MSININPPVTSLDAFRKLAKEYDVIPIVREVIGDLDTPITAFWKLKRGNHSFLLESVEGGETWARYTFMGTEPLEIYTASGRELTITSSDGRTETRSVDNPLDTIFAHVANRRVYTTTDLPRFPGGLVGAISYDAVRIYENIPDLLPSSHVPELIFMKTRVVLAWDNLKHRSTLIYLAWTDTGVDPETLWADAQRELAETAERLGSPLPDMPHALPTTHPVTVAVDTDDNAYCKIVRDARRYIESGDVIQVVLSRTFTQPTEGLHPFLVYRTLRTLNPSPYMFYVELGDTVLVGASPEVLVRKGGTLLESRPIAGTRPRGLSAEEDRVLADELLADPKERAEHVMLVDLARNDLGRISATSSIQVTEQMVIERYSHVMHLVSHVVGQLDHQSTLSDILTATFPAGTLSGAPKIRAMEIIEELETSRRGFYGGAIGTVGIDNNLEFCISIRMLTVAQNKFSTRAGAGIVYDSVPQTEAEETRSKARAVLRAIEEARMLFREEQ
jgi:anthranilate synthase component 1